MTFGGRGSSRDRLRRRRFTIERQAPLDHLDAVAGQVNDTLDVSHRVVGLVRQHRGGGVAADTQICRQPRQAGDDNEEQKEAERRCQQQRAPVGLPQRLLAGIEVCLSHPRSPVHIPAFWAR